MAHVISISTEAERELTFVNGTGELSQTMKLIKNLMKLNIVI